MFHKKMSWENWKYGIFRYPLQNLDKNPGNIIQNFFILPIESNNTILCKQKLVNIQISKCVIKYISVMKSLVMIF